MAESIDRPDRPVVMVVDDDRERVDIYVNHLSPDYEVVTAFGGREALEKIDPTVDVVLLDRRMPDLHGDEVLEQIRARDIDCRVVMVTAIDPSLDVISLDFDEYLVKPVSRERLREVVDQMLARAALDDHLLDAFALASKMATLESKLDPVELESSEDYAELEAQFAEYREVFGQIDPNDNLYAELSATKLKALFADA